MGAPRKEMDSERLGEARRLYENTLTPVREIAAMLGVSRATLDNRIAELGWLRRHYVSGGAKLADDPQASEKIAASAPELPVAPVETPPAPQESNANLATRLERIFAGQCDVIDSILKVLRPANSGEAERASRTLASIMHTLQSLKATATSAGLTPPDAADDDPVPRDMDAFREELARRLHALIDASAPDPGGAVGHAGGRDVEPGP